MKNKRTWYYCQSPVVFEMQCDKCEGQNITWSEFERMIWCYDCEIDTEGYKGIFDGPVPIHISGLIGMSFDRYNMETCEIEKFDIEKADWLKEESK